jgi:hypothetical protein
VSLDVTAQVRVAREPLAVWQLMTDPAREPEWIGGLRDAQLIGDPPLREGSRVRRVASFLGRRIEYVNEIAAMDAPRLLDMRSVVAPFPMRITYTLEGADETTVRNRVRGGTRLSALMAPLVRRNIQRDLDRLRELAEQA